MLNSIKMAVEIGEIRCVLNDDGMKADLQSYARLTKSPHKYCEGFTAGAVRFELTTKVLETLGV